MYWNVTSSPRSVAKCPVQVNQVFHPRGHAGRSQRGVQQIGASTLAPQGGEQIVGGDGMTKRRARRRKVFRTQEAEGVGDTRRARSQSLAQAAQAVSGAGRARHSAWCRADLRQDVDWQDNYVRRRRPAAPSTVRRQRPRTRKALNPTSD